MLNKDMKLCISLSARPSNNGTRFHNFLYEELGLDWIYKAFAPTDLAQAIAGVRGLGIRGCAISMQRSEGAMRSSSTISARYRAAPMSPISGRDRCAYARTCRPLRVVRAAAAAVRRSTARSTTDKTGMFATMSTNCSASSRPRLGCSHLARP